MSSLDARGAFVLAALLSSAVPAAAQQFQYQAGALPGAARWTEGVTSADVDNDGDLDVFFAEGEGFSSAGTKRQNILLVNKLVENGSLSFADESVARLGTHLSNAKGVCTGDADGDGYQDALFANAFNTDTPFLYMNRGAAQPGFFDLESSTRGLTTVLNSASAQFGDLDDDGDLDLVINHVGANYLGGAGAKPKLYINDGTGHFAEKTGAGWNPPNKAAQMDVQFTDVDGDWDLDFVGYCRTSNTGGNHYLMLNDGAANFTDASTTLPNGSTSCYEAEVADLDGDTDIDVFMVSLSGFQEGAVRNNWIENGQTTLSFTALSPLSLAQDDNEIALCDFDNDGDLDAFVGSLGTQERLWRNDGGMTFAANHTAIQVVSDSTLDCTFADVDNDGDYDLITAQGESNSAQWANKLYLNTGSPDTIAPKVLGRRIPDPLTSDVGPWLAYAKIQDQVLDDGENYCGATAHFVVNPAPTNPFVTIQAGSFSPANLNVPAGTLVTWQNAAGGAQSVTSTTAPWTYDSGTLANGQLYQHAFVRPGVYAYTSGPGGFSGTVTVTGSADAVAGTRSGGGLYRFAMTGNAAGASTQLYYELEFTDWAGNVSVTDAEVIIKSASTGTAYCFGDGTGTSCPCNNHGAAGAGCMNSTGNGARLSAEGTPSVGADTVVLKVSDSTPGQPGLFFQGDNAVNGGLGTTFGDGLRCAGGGVVRLQVRVASGTGEALTTIGLAAKGGVGAGQTKRYQWWYRDPSFSPCLSAFNLSNGLELSWN
ncbi:MAG: VCBS repeat-containing protein [Planctomycetes bacterium]|nr:VCBS repeat-containing protein [Planctomycetota bacterium]